MWLEKRTPAFQSIGVFERHSFVMFSILVEHFLVQEVRFILGPVLLDFSQNIIQSNMSSGNIVTHVLLVIQCSQILEYVIGFFGGADQKCTGDVMFLFEVTTHGYTGIRLSTTSGPTENEESR